MIELHRILTEARDLVTKGHTKLAAARTSEGIPCSPRSDAAAAYCVMGALIAAEAEDEIEAAQKALLHAGGWTGYPLASWNDVPERTQADVVALFDKTLFEIGGMTEMEYALRRARALIAAGWVQIHIAYDTRTKRAVESHDPSADAFCALGAFLRVGGDPGRRGEVYAFLPLFAVKKHLGKSLAEWNDTRGRTQAQVLAQFDVWIAAARADKYWGLE